MAAKDLPSKFVIRFNLKQTERSNGGQVDARRAGSPDLMKQALILHLSALKKLVAKKLLLDSVRLVIEMLKDQGSIARDWACVREETFSSKKNEYSLLLISDFSDSTPTMRPDNLQDFIGDQRAAVNDQQLLNIDEGFSDFTNRNALAVLFESILPWVNFGTEDGEVLPPDQSDEA